MAENTGLPDISKANLYGMTDEDRQQLLDANEKALQALQSRYENPNWFNVAAGFFKPQLGGFAASLGSASQALGESLEKQRANELPVAQARAQVALMRNQMSQSKTAAGMAADLLNKPGGLTGEDVASVSHYDPARGEILQKELTNQQALRKEIMEAHAAGRSDAELAAQYGPRFNLLYPQGTPNVSAVPGAAKPAQAKGAAGVDIDKPPMESGLTQSVWDTMPLKQKNQVIENISGANTENLFAAEKALREPAQSAPQDVARLKTMRELATAPGMEAVFGVLKGSDFMSLVGQGLSEGRLTDRLSNLENILRQANIKDPNVLRNVAQLEKLINEQKMSSGFGSLATDQARAMQSEANPSFNNPQSAFVNLTDAIAHTRRHQYDLWNAVSGNNPEGKRRNAYSFVGSEEWKPLNKSYQERHSSILNNPMRLDAPADIYDFAQNPKTNKENAQITNTPSAKTPITLDALDAAIARKAAKKGTP